MGIIKRDMFYPEDDGKIYAVVPNSQSQEPAAKVGASVTAFLAIIAIVAEQFPNFLSSQTYSWIFFMAALLGPLVTAFLTRGFVWSPASVQKILNEAIKEASRK